MKIRTLTTRLAACSLGLLATVGCDEVSGPAIAEVGPSSSAVLPPVYDHRRDEARTRVVVGEGVDESAWQGSATTPTLTIGNPHPFEIAPVGDWAPPAGTLPQADGPAPFRLADGEVCTFGSQEWGSLCADDADGAGCMRDSGWAEALPSGLVIGGEHKFVLTSAQATADALPATGAIGPLARSVDDPMPMNANQIAGEVAALQMNIAFARTGYLGTYDFGAVRVMGGMFDGWAVAGVAEFASRLVGGEAYLESGVEFVGYNALLDELQALNAAGKDCRAADYIRR